MNLQTGLMKPTAEQLAHVHEQADESFCAVANDGFHHSLPSVSGFKCASNGILLRLSNVAPHQDPWVSRGKGPRLRRAIFWLLDVSEDRGLNSIWFGCGSKTIQLLPGEWVFFDDSKTHWVMSEKEWYGVSWQLNKV